MTMLNRVLKAAIPNRHRRYLTTGSFPSAKSFFSSERKAKLTERIAKVQSLRPPSKIGVQDPSKRAAVLIPFVIVNDEPSLLFTARATHLRAHAGEISYPGGKFDGKHDKVIEDSALRETQEELGIKAELFEPWGTLAPVQSRDGATAVTPVIGLLKVPFIPDLLRINPEEVASVFTCTVRALCAHQNQGFTQFRTGYTLPVYFGNESHETPKIWGLTAIITHLCLSAMAPEWYKHRLPYLKMRR